MNTELQKIRCGSAMGQPEYQWLEVGSWRFMLDGGTLRYIHYEGIEVIRGIYAAVRDANWKTIPSIIKNLHLTDSQDERIISFEAIHCQGNIDFRWTGNIKVNRGGKLRFDMDGNAGSDFYKNRIGFCVLHPLSEAGRPMKVQTQEGEMSGYFPELIEPFQPVSDIISISSNPVDGLSMQLLFEGETFEMEDQRNWTDASFKTYCTPLKRPFPVLVKTGEKIHQSVTLSLKKYEKIFGRLKHREHSGSPVNCDSGTGELFSGIGLECAFTGRCYSDDEAEHLKKLNLHCLFTTVNLDREEWISILSEAGVKADLLQVPLNIEMIADPKESQFDSFFFELSKLKHPPAALRVFPHSGFKESGFVTTRKILDISRRYLKKYGIDCMLGGGSRSNFTEFNRADLPVEVFDFACYPMNPQVHASDLISIMETIEVQRATVRTAKKHIGELPLHLGPITFTPRCNPAAASPDDMERAEDWRCQTDSRQHSFFAAGWLIGSLRALAGFGIGELTYFRDLGPLGLISENVDCVSPLYAVLEKMGEMCGGDVLPIYIHSYNPMTALGLRKDEKYKLFLANLSGQPKEISLLGILDNVHQVKRLNEQAFLKPGRKSDFWCESSFDSRKPLHVPAYGILLLEGNEMISNVADLGR